MKAACFICTHIKEWTGFVAGLLNAKLMVIGLFSVEGGGGGKYNVSLDGRKS